MKPKRGYQFMNQNIEVFSFCCHNTTIKKFKIEHPKKPIDLDKDKILTIEWLLWYVPNISSKQSLKNKDIDNPKYSDSNFRDVLNSLEMKNSDAKTIVLVRRNEEGISTEMVKDYKRNLCLNCQKVILTVYNETKTVSLLRHLRNIIAHGNFNIISNTFIGFDYLDEKEATCTAIVKIEIKKLNDLIDFLKENFSSNQSRLSMLAREQVKIGYQYVRAESTGFDSIMTKDNHFYYQQLEVFSLPNFVKAETIIEKTSELMTKYSSAINNSIEPSNHHFVLVIEKNRISEKSRQNLAMRGIHVLDIDSIDRIIEGNDELEYTRRNNDLLSLAD